MAPELVLVPLTAGVREFNCLFHSFSAQGPRAKGDSNVRDRRRNEAENTSAGPRILNTGIMLNLRGTFVQKLPLSSRKTMKNKLRDIHERRIRQSRWEKVEAETLKDRSAENVSSSTDELSSAFNSKVTLKASIGPRGTRNPTAVSLQDRIPWRNQDTFSASSHCVTKTEFSAD